jgi:outer membrane protein assembly factor BamE (lipoprotein component of BamABCDE complex)
MKIIRERFIILLILILTQGCIGSLKAQLSTQMGKKPNFSAEEVNKIKVGLTTLEEIKDMFGKPNYISKSINGENTFGYIWVKATGTIRGSGKRTSTEGAGTITSNNIFLIIKFNREKIVKSFEFSDVPPFLFR